VTRKPIQRRGWSGSACNTGTRSAAFGQPVKLNLSHHAVHIQCRHWQRSEFSFHQKRNQGLWRSLNARFRTKGPVFAASRAEPAIRVTGSDPARPEGVKRTLVTDVPAACWAGACLAWRQASSGPVGVCH
jgi:hypothetical protein